jgi:hypothetical protein
MEQITELENYIEEQELEQETETVIEQVPNTYYYDKLYDDKHLGSFTESTQLAHQLGWQDNTVAITDTEVSELNGWTYLKGYAPKKSESMVLIEQYQSEIVELKKYLSDTDYKAIKFAEGELSESDYQEVKSQRHDARVRINELESLIEELEKENNAK